MFTGNVNVLDPTAMSTLTSNNVHDFLQYNKKTLGVLDAYSYENEKYW